MFCVYKQVRSKVPALLAGGRHFLFLFIALAETVPNQDTHSRPQSATSSGLEREQVSGGSARFLLERATPPSRDRAQARRITDQHQINRSEGATMPANDDQQHQKVPTGQPGQVPGK